MINLKIEKNKPNDIEYVMKSTKINCNIFDAKEISMKNDYEFKYWKLIHL
jgi:hypothetical protein